MTSKTRRALVTGATGFIGSHLVKRMVADGWAIDIIARPQTNLDILGPVQSKITVHRHDGSTEGMIDLVGKAKPEVVFHVASMFLSQHEPSHVEPLVKSNVCFPAQLLEAMAIHNIPSLVNTGTSWQNYHQPGYNPVNLYASTKQAFEDILAYYIDIKALKAVTLALFDTYGPGDPRPKLISLLWKTALSQEPIAMSPGEQLIDIVHVEDVVDAYLCGSQLVLEQEDGHCRFGISSGNPVPLRELVQTFESCTGYTLPITWGSRPYRAREVMTSWETYEPLPGWSPKVSFQDGIKGMNPHR